LPPEGDEQSAARRLTMVCPCGERLTGSGEDDLVARAYAHLAESHPDLVDEYTRDDILAFAH
jgi:hypothetical protein